MQPPPAKKANSASQSRAQKKRPRSPPSPGHFSADGDDTDGSSVGTPAIGASNVVAQEGEPVPGAHRRLTRSAKGAASGLSGLFNKVGPLGDDSDRSSVGTPATGA